LIPLQSKHCYAAQVSAYEFLVNLSFFNQMSLAACRLLDSCHPETVSGSYGYSFVEAARC